jgi:hypothetical protein
VSSIRYKVFREGIAIKIRRRAGLIVHMVSTSCLSDEFLLNVLFFVKIIITWSWKNSRCSIEGEAGS